MEILVCFYKYYNKVPIKQQFPSLFLTFFFNSILYKVQSNWIKNQDEQQQKCLTLKFQG